MRALVFTTIMLAAGGAAAQAGAQVVSARCLVCHDAERKKMGPSFRQIAATRKGAEAQMLAKLKEGKGHPRIAAPEAELRAALEHVMATK